ncbi:P-loop containing nucleoside triphosphate hydrolase protein [Dipodascopsis uninucleata]
MRKNALKSTSHHNRHSDYESNITKILIKLQKQAEIAEKHVYSSVDDFEPSNPSNNSSQLWVEKWRAKKWIDLIGDERTHRSLLRWLQQWSHAVFKRSTVQTLRLKKNDSVNIDPFQRPYKKILLLHGSPGLGKTTVAHVAARQAGYDVLEINASDERGGPLVKEKILGALESHSIGSRPTCVVIDEIDGGAESGFIRALMDILNSDTKATQHQDRKSTMKLKNGRAKNNGKLLMRPIIAICNDPYVSALRSLRPHTEMLMYRRAATSTIVTRLKEICNHEKLPVDTQSLTDLVEAMDGDVRGCVNALQFELRGNKKFELSGIGSKDINSSPSFVVARTFRQDPKFTRAENMKKVVDCVEQNAEFDKIINGCFAAYLSMQYSNDMLDKEVQAGDWLHFYDTLSNSIYKDQNRDLMGYLSYPICAFHMQFSSAKNSRSLKDYSSNKADFEMREHLSSNRDISKHLMSKTPVTLRNTFKTEFTIASELAPYLQHIMNPQLNPINGTLALVHERKLLMHSVQVLLSMNIKYFQQRTEHGVYVYRTDPPIERLAFFSEKDQERAAVGKYLVRQLLAQECERQAILTGEAQSEHQTLTRLKRRKTDSEVDLYSDDMDLMDPETRLNSTTKTPGQKAKKVDLLSSPLSARADVKVMPQPEAVRPIRTSLESFLISRKPENEQSVQQSDEKWRHNRQNSYQDKHEKHKQDRETEVWLQFHEGFSNAVRKPVVWADFWKNL